MGVLGFLIAAFLFFFVMAPLLLTGLVLLVVGTIKDSQRLQKMGDKLLIIFLVILLAVVVIWLILSALE